MKTPLLVITTRFRAFISVALTCWLFALGVRSLMMSRPSSHAWLLSGVFPGWAVVAVNVAFYSCVLWSAVQFAATPMRKDEKTLALSFIITMLLAPVSTLLPGIIYGLRIVKTLLELTAFLAALTVLVSFSDEVAETSSPDEHV